jgi:DNA-binding HxlR family transcriptional regulator
VTQRTSFDGMSCSVARTLDVIGEWWTPLILRDVILGLTKFDEIQDDLGISRKVLTQRLDALVEHGVLERVPYQERPVRHDYVPTEMGADLAPVILAMQAWGDRWLNDKPPVVVRHDTCGRRTTVVPACAECGEPVLAHEITLEPGPGLEGADGPEAQAAFARLARREALRGQAASS